MNTISGAFNIQGVLQQYAWGLPASHALVAKLSGNTIAPETPCAELWFGAHPRAASPLLDNPSQTLHSIIAGNVQQLLGSAVAARFQTLPFMFKVLSVGKALSIQAHPTRDHAAELHAKDPQHYPDASDKPEIGVALTRVRLLYGLKPLQELPTLLTRIPELTTLLGSALVQKVHTRADEPGLYRAILTHVYGKERAEVAACTTTCAARLEKKTLEFPEEFLFMELFSQFPCHDVGLLIAHFLNLIELKPGEAIFIGANTPHAYLSGELIECMATSDNVVRAGLTEKFQDVSALLSMLSFEPELPKRVLPDKPTADGISWYSTPAREFRLGLVRQRATVPQGAPMLIVVLEGSASVVSASESIELSSGKGVFIGAHVPARVITVPHGCAAIVSVP